MTREEVIRALSCATVSEGKEFGGEKVLKPVYKQLSFVGKPLYAFGDGSENGWEIGDPEKNMKYFRFENKKLIIRDKLQEKRK